MTADYSVKGKESLSKSFPAFLTVLSSSSKMGPPSPCIYTPPDALGTSIGDSISILPNTIRADTPRPSETGNMSTSVDSAGNATQQNDLIVDHLLTLSNMTATLLSQSQKLSPWQAAVVEKSVSAMLSAVGGESKNKPVDLATSPPSSDQDKSS